MNEPLDPTLLCAIPGCGGRWSCNFGWKLCSRHDEMRTHGTLRRDEYGPAPASPVRSVTAALPFREAARPFTEVDRDEREF